MTRIIISIAEKRPGRFEIVKVRQDSKKKASRLELGMANVIEGAVQDEIDGIMKEAARRGIKTVREVADA